jgi:hypothetical protein
VISAMQRKSHAWEIARLQVARPSLARRSQRAGTGRVRIEIVLVRRAWFFPGGVLRSLAMFHKDALSIETP